MKSRVALSVHGALILILALCGGSSFASAAFAQSAGPAPSSESAPVDEPAETSPPALGQPASTDSGAPRTTPAPTVGFEAGRSLFRLYSGPPLAAPAGSFIRHEKLYDRTLQLAGQAGQLESAIPSLPPIVFSSSYENGGLFGVDFEYGLTSHVGAGLTLSITNVFARRQDVFRGLSPSRQILEPYPEDSVALSVTSLQILLTLHPLPARRLDPYLVVRGGPAFASGEAHSGFHPDLIRINDSIHNGRGFSYGGGAGLNLHLNALLAMNLEASYQFSALRADQFNSRTSYNSYLTLGVIIKPEF
jgi:hypothetical protein